MKTTNTHTNTHNPILSNSTLKNIQQPSQIKTNIQKQQHKKNNNQANLKDSTSNKHYFLRNWAVGNNNQANHNMLQVKNSQQCFKSKNVINLKNKLQKFNRTNGKNKQEKVDGFKNKSSFIGFNVEDVKLVKIDPNRVSRYRYKDQFTTDAFNDSQTFKFYSYSHQNKNNQNKINKKQQQNSQKKKNSLPTNQISNIQLINSNNSIHSFKNNYFSQRNQRKPLQKWSTSLQRYMNARVKMSQYFNITKKTSGPFNQIALDKKNKILQKRKLEEQLKNTIAREQHSRKQEKQFISDLVVKESCKKVQIKANHNNNKQGDSKINNKFQIRKHSKSDHHNSNETKKSQELHRCDALLVNFVSTYFRRKFYKKNKKTYTMRRYHTQVIDEYQDQNMIDFQGQSINCQGLINISVPYLKKQQSKPNIKQQIKNNSNNSKKNALVFDSQRSNVSFGSGGFSQDFVKNSNIKFS